jgi:eukaryotic-like serine/threonine-protein kinase
MGARSTLRIATRYELGERLGSGGMGEVYAAHDVRLDRPVALKLLRSDLAGTPAMRARIEAEARLAARIHHPNVVAVLDAGVTDDGHPFLVMERLPGGTLRDELAGGPLSEEDVRTLGRQMLGGLTAAHALHVVHRDVKPGNVLQGQDGRWKLADFGIAKWLLADETVTATGEVLGSPAYLAPERLAGREASSASDVYAAGVVLYEALSGRRPFDGDDPFAVAMAARDGRATPLSSLRPAADPRLVAAIERAMAVDPSVRWPSAAAFREALAHGTAGPPTLTVPLPPQGDPTRTSPLPPPASDADPRPHLATTAPMPIEDGPTRLLPSEPRSTTRRRTAVAAIVVALLLVAGVAAALAAQPGPIPVIASPASDPGIAELGVVLAPPEEQADPAGDVIDEPPSGVPNDRSGSNAGNAGAEKEPKEGNQGKGPPEDKPGKGPKD